MNSKTQKKLSIFTIAAVMLLPSFAYAQLGEPPHPSDLADLVARRNWPLAAAAVIWSIVRLLKEDTRLPDALNIRSDLRPLVPMFLSALSAVLEHLLAGVGWRDALSGAVVTAISSIVFQDVVVKALLAGVLKVRVPLPAALAARSAVPPSAGPVVIVAPSAVPPSADSVVASADEIVLTGTEKNK